MKVASRSAMPQRPSPEGPERTIKRGGAAAPPAARDWEPPERRGGWRDKGEADSERQRTRERLEATLAGLGELKYLRHRQQLLVKAALFSGPRSLSRAEPDSPHRSLEEQILEENILILRKQLNCLRRRDAGLLNQLHELDKQISDLQIDVEKTPNEHLETDSRPSSGFYELSDGTSGSLSNSSNSVFSECLSSCHSSTCFSSPLEVSLGIPDGRPKSADDLLDWNDHKEGSHGDQTSSTVRRSLSAPNSNSSDVVADVHPRYQCDLVSKNGSDVYRYPSPLHAVAVQSPMFLISVMESFKEEEHGCNENDAYVKSATNVVKPETSLQNNLCSAPCTSSIKELDRYILGVIQKKVHPVRTNKPRTSVNVDPSKGILRHGSICLRQTSGVSLSNSANPKNAKGPCLHSSATKALAVSTLSPKQWSKEPLENRRMPASSSYPPSYVNELQSKNMYRGNMKSASPVLSCSPDVMVDLEKQSASPSFTTSVKESPCRYTAGQLENKVIQPPKKLVSKNHCKSPYPIAPPLEERPQLDFKSEGSSSQSFEEGLLVNAQYIPAQEQGVKLHTGTRNLKVVKSSTLKHRTHVVHVLENGSQTLKDKNKTGKKCRFPDLDVTKKSKRLALKGKKMAHLQLENGLPSRSLVLAKALNRPPGRGKEGVLAKPKYKRGDYRRWKSSAEMSYEEALRRVRVLNGIRPVGGFSAQVPPPYTSPYAYIASDSEYSAECESLFHSTVVDTSEDERSNYTTNCFGDSESSLSEVEFVGESTTSSDSDESGGLIWSQFVQTLPLQTATATELHKTAKAFVKIKASHNLKKKILRFRSGSLKLMTTV